MVHNDHEGMRVTATHDFISLLPVGRRRKDEPRFSRRARAYWPRKHRGQRFTIHDPHTKDVHALAHAWPDAVVDEMEISLDFTSKLNLDSEAHLLVLKHVVVNVFAKQLYPAAGVGMGGASRVLFRHTDDGYVIGRFNFRLPRPSDQLLYGFRDDIVQVKVYLKVWDAGRALDAGDRVARVEVALRRGLLDLLGIRTVKDLVGFDYRKKLMPYFRFIRGVKVRRADPAVCGLSGVRRAEREQRKSDRVWERVGIGGFQGQGKRAHIDHRLLRDTTLNHMVGQALHSLQKAMRPKLHLQKSVAILKVQEAANEALARAAA